MTEINSDINETIEDYRHSRQLLQSRIHELNGQICAYLKARTPGQSGAELKKLLERRHRLYAMIWDLDYAIRSMSEYMDCHGTANRFAG